MGPFQAAYQDEAGNLYDADGNRIEAGEEVRAADPVGVGGKLLGQTLDRFGIPNGWNADATSWRDAGRNTAQYLAPFAFDESGNTTQKVPQALTDVAHGVAAPAEIMGNTPDPRAMTPTDAAAVSLGTLGAGGLGSAVARGGSGLAAEAGSRLGLTDPYLSQGAAVGAFGGSRAKAAGFPMIGTGSRPRMPSMEEYVGFLSKSRDGRPALLDYSTYITQPFDNVGVRSEPMPYKDWGRKTPQNVKNLSHPVHTKRLRELRDQGLFEGPDGTPQNPWYYPAPLLKEWRRVHGDRAGEEAYGKFADHVGATSPLTNVSDNIREASHAYKADMSGGAIEDGLIDQFSGIARRNKLDKVRSVAAGEGLAGADPQKIANFARNLRGEGTVEPVYDQAGNLVRTPVTIDSQMLEAMRFRSPNGSLKERALGPNYTSAADTVRTLGDEVGAAGADAQAAIWQSHLAQKHGNRVFGDRYQDSFARSFEDRVNQTAEFYGLDPQQVLDEVIRGERALYTSPLEASPFAYYGEQDSEQ